ncbi:MAG TPA: acyltransferase, partial [Burkholderiales bacterium]|nr:acyltransferase [Burkholderiales bacterium]
MSRSFSTTRSPHWADIDEFSFVFGMRLLLLLYRALGRWPFYVLLGPVVLWYMAMQPAARAASREYLGRLANSSGDCARKPTLADVARHFAAFAETLLDKLLLWGGWCDAANIRLFGNELIAREVAARRGGIIICAHFGNLELCRVMSRREPGLKLTVLTHTLHAKKFNRLLARLDPESQINLLQVTELTPATAIMLATKVERGEFIAIAGDRIPVSRNAQVAWAAFLGAPAPFPIGAYVLASLLQCPTYTLFALRRGGSAEMHFELFRESIRLPRRARAAALKSLAQDYAARL